MRYHFILSIALFCCISVVHITSQHISADRSSVVTSPGDLDPSFGKGGKVITGIGSNQDAIYSLAIQKDGRLVAAGYSNSGLNDDFALARYNTDGSLDTSFGSGGKVITAVTDSIDRANAVAIQEDGRIVAAGFKMGSPQDDFALVRYNQDGSLDTSFGSAGKVITAFSSSDDEIYAVAIQSDGRIVVAGTTYATGHNAFALARYNENGSLDTTFGSGGKVTTAIGTYDEARAVAIQPDGKIVAAGSIYLPSSYQFGVVRYNSDGSLDMAFGTGGKVSTAFGSTEDAAHSIALQAGGRIVVSGYSLNGTTYEQALARYEPDGSLDPSFGSGGKVTTAFAGSIHWYSSTVIQTNGQIVTSSSCYAGSTQYFTLARYNSDGALDPSFGVGGKVTTAVGEHNNYEHGTSLVIQPDGGLVVAGNRQAPSAGGDNDFALARYDSSGTLDTSFGNAGIVTTRFEAGADEIRAIAIQPDGKIVAVGSTPCYRDCLALARYNPDGTLDPTFGSGGIVVTGFGSYYNAYARSLAIQADGRLVVAGYIGGSSNYDFLLARYNSDGSLDLTFGSGGFVNTAFGTRSEEAYAVAIQNDGRIVAAGDTDNGSNYDFALARYETNGSLDASFGSGGKITSSFTQGSYETIFALAIQSNGKIIAAGNGGGTGLFSYGDFALMRYNVNGSLDTSFGSGGKVLTQFSTALDQAQAVALQPDGRIVAAGYSGNGATGFDFALARYDSNGSLDTTFGSGGKVNTAFGTGADCAEALAIQNDGRIIAAGYLHVGTNNDDFLVARYDGNGTLDPSFGTGGKSVTPINSGNDEAYAAAIQADGNIVVGGTSSTGGSQNTDFALARYFSETAVPSPTPTSTPGFMSDVAPRPDGDGLIQSDDVVEVQRFQIGLDTLGPGSNEFERADSAPRSTHGDGVIRSDDVVQTQRYQIGLDPKQSCSAPPDDPISSQLASNTRPTDPAGENMKLVRSINIGEPVFFDNHRVSVNLLVDARGDESAYGFTLGYDASVFTDPVVTMATAGGRPACNTLVEGQVICSVSGFDQNLTGSSTDQIGEIHAGRNQMLLTITFSVASRGTKASRIRLVNVNASDDQARALPMRPVTL